MPSVTPAHRALRDELRQSVTESLTLNAQLESVIHVKSRQPGTFHGKVDHSQPPWAAPIANAVLDLHAMAREMEAWLRLSQGLRPKERGGSSENTKKALENVVRLNEAADDGTVKDHTRQLNKWHYGGRIALGFTEKAVRLPRTKGEKPRMCPWCKADTLRMRPLKGEISCIDLTCLDENERRPRGVMEFSVIAADWVVVWQDGLAGLP